jgi:hypothetical protein
VWNGIMRQIRYFPPKFVKAYYMLYRNETQKRELQSASREDWCMDLIRRNPAMNIALSAMFVEKSSVSNDGKAKVHVSVNIITTSQKGKNKINE